MKTIFENSGSSYTHNKVIIFCQILHYLMKIKVKSVFGE